MWHVETIGVLLVAIATIAVAALFPQLPFELMAQIGVAALVGIALIYLVTLVIVPLGYLGFPSSSSVTLCDPDVAIMRVASATSRDQVLGAVATVMIRT